MNRLILVCCVWVLLGAGMEAQVVVPETSSNFVNFNLNTVNRVRAYLPFYNGQGLIASIKEFRYDTLDIDLSDRHLPSAFSTNATDSHTTLMASILAGGGNSFRNGLGVAWGARLTSSSFLNIFPDDNSYFRQFGISLQNHSYGIDTIENYYGPIAAAYDLQALQLPELLHVFSIGNLGLETPSSGPYAGLSSFANMSGEFKLAKNVLTMGVVDSTGLIDPRSSHGPAFDGRTKPELVAFGIGGSSTAAALASGSVLLLQQAYEEIEGKLPPAALVKALLVNGARDLGPVGVDHTYGFGSIDVYRSLQNVLAGRYRTATLRFDETDRLLIDVPEGVRELRITLSWADPPAAVNAPTTLVNDLDLSLIRQTDQVSWFPQILSTFPDRDSLALAAVSGRDHLNNLEQIVLSAPASGRYEIRVDAYQFGVADQEYQLVYDWDTLQGFRWVFPSKNDQIIPSDKFYERLYWESADTGATGRLSYSLDGQNWIPVREAVPLAGGNTQWSAPDTLSRAQLRMEIGGQFYLSDTFTLSPQPFMQVVLNCADSVGLSWSPIAGAARYRLSRLGTAYMEPILDTPDTFVIVSRADLLQPYMALAPILTDGSPGVRSLAYDLSNEVENCYEQTFSGEVIDLEGHLYLRLSSNYGVASLVLERQVAGQFLERQRINQPGGVFFEFTDSGLQRGLNLYRVRIILQNGDELYTSLVELSFIEPDRFLLYPNPVSRQGSFQVLYNVAQPEEVNFHLYTALGAQVISLNLSELETVLFAEDLQSGMYFYRFMRDGKLLQSGKLVVR